MLKIKCDQDLCLNLQYDFGKMISTLGSVVPLAMFKYHNRNRKNLRKTFSLYTATLVIVWIIFLVLKVAVYVFGFMNNFFSSLPADDKFVFAMASSLDPVSVPSKEKKGD